MVARGRNCPEFIRVHANGRGVGTTVGGRMGISVAGLLSVTEVAGGSVLIGAAVEACHSLRPVESVFVQAIDCRHFVATVEDHQRVDDRAACAA